MLYRTLSRVIALALAAALPLCVQAGEPVSVNLPVTNVAYGAAPMKVSGLWCGVGLLRDFSLDMAQQFNLIEAKLVRKGRVRQITGRIDGSTLRTDPQRNETLELQALGNELRVTAGTGPLALLQGQAFTRATAGSCTH
jgi:hypothetical protein